MIDKERHRWQARCHQMTGDLANIIEECCSTYNCMTNFWAFEFQTVVCGKNSLSNSGGHSCCCISQNHIIIFFQFYFKLILSSLPLDYTGKFKEKKKIPPWKKHHDANGKQINTTGTVSGQLFSWSWLCADESAVHFQASLL